MTVHVELVRQVAVNVAGRAAARAIRLLSKMPSGLSGDDSGLRSAWEEFCVQVQGEESFFWDEYVQTVKQCLSGVLSRLPHLEMVALWLQSDAADEWLAEHEAERELPGVLESDVVDVVYDVLWRLADESRNPRVVRYRSRSGELD